MATKKNIEVELRGPLTEEQAEELRANLDQHGSFIETKERVLIDYSTFLPGEGIRNRKKDIRVRVTNGIPEIVIKIGAWGGDEARREISAAFHGGSFDTLVQIFGELGYAKGILAVRTIHVYEYKEAEIAVVVVPDYCKSYEIEKIINDENARKKTLNELNELCRELHLKVFDTEETYAYIERLNRDANEVFDYSTYTPGDFEKRFNLHTTRKVA